MPNQVSARKSLGNTDTSLCINPHFLYINYDLICYQNYDDTDVEYDQHYPAQKLNIYGNHIFPDPI